MMTLRRSILAIGILFAAAFSAPSAFAMTISPVKFEFSVAPGSSVSGVVTLINETEKAETYALSVKNFIASGEVGAQTYLDEAEPAGLAAWVRADRPAVTLEPKTSAEIPFTISAPADAEPGGHYATIFFTRGPGAVDGSGVGIAEQVGALLLVSVPGNVREALEVDSFRIAGPSVMSRLPVALELRVRNAGSVHEKPAGTIDVRNMFGNVVARLDANPTRAAVLPNSIRRFSNGWQKSTDGDVRGFFAGAKEEWRNFGFGKYTATVNATYGRLGTAIESRTVSFWIIPWRLMAIGASLATALVILILLYNRMLVRIVLRRARR
jgi:hypothetical protein